MQNDMVYRQIALREIDEELLKDYVRHQVVTNIRRKADGVWRTIEHPFVDDWTEADRRHKVAALRAVVQTDGYLIGAFADEKLKGFAAVESELLGSRRQYAELSLLHVSEELRGQGIGRALFLRAAQYAKMRGVERLYISAHSAAETQAFYRAMGCEEAEEYSASHVKAEPFDCQLEYRLDQLRTSGVPLMIGEVSIELRELGYEQAAQIAEIFTAVFTAEPWRDDWSDREQLGQYILDLAGNANSLSLGLYEGETLIGISLGRVKHWYEGTEYCIDELGIRPDRQGQGIGGAFLRLMEAFSRQRGIKAIVLQTEKDVPAYRFYLKNGFSERPGNVFFVKMI